MHEIITEKEIYEYLNEMSDRWINHTNELKTAKNLEKYYDWIYKTMITELKNINDIVTLINNFDENTKNKISFKIYIIGNKLISHMQKSLILSVKKQIFWDKYFGKIKEIGLPNTGFLKFSKIND